MGLLIASPPARLATHQVRGLLAKASPADATTPVRGTATRWAPGPTAPIGPPGAGTGRRRGRGRALAAVLGVVALVAGLAGGWFGHAWVADPRPSNMDRTFSYGPGGDIPVFDYSGSSNTCFDGKLEPNHSYGEDSSKECDERHDIEAFDNRETFKTSTSSEQDGNRRPVIGYPGKEALARYAESHCAMSFASTWLKVPPSPEIRFRALVPSEALWNESQAAAQKSSSDDSKRLFYCVAYRADGLQLDTMLRVGSV